MAEQRPVKRVKKARKKRTSGKIIISILCIGVLGIGIAGSGLLGKHDKSEQPLSKTTEPIAEYENDEHVQKAVKKNGYAVSTSCTEASKAGAEILEQGGNAVDAAIAAAYALSVVEPYGSGLGGGGSMVIYDPDTDDYYFYNYGSEAPRSGGSSQILVPGFVSGMETVREDLGTMELEELLAPAIRYCDGFEINAEFENRIDRASGTLGTDSVFYRDGHWLTEGETLVQPELKMTLQTLVEEGAESFYTGSIAESIVSATGFTMDDLEAYETIKTSPVISTYRDYDIVSAAAPYSGETLIQMLKMMELLDIDSPEENREDFLEKLERATLASHADRSVHVYDLRFSNERIDENNYVTDTYIKELLNLDTDDIEIEEESEDTTGFTIVDKNGMVVACTNTLSHFFGSRVNVGGFYLNNSGVNFGSGVNARESGKRPRTHISPTILRKDGEVFAIASPGGNAIVKVLAEVIMDICRFGTDPQKAVDKQRVMFRTGGVIYYETGYDTEALVKVQGSGYRAVPVENHSVFGNVALSGYREGSGFYAVKDIRRNGNCMIENE